MKSLQIIKNKSNEITDVNPDYIIAIGGGGLIPSCVYKTNG